MLIKGVEAIRQHCRKSGQIPEKEGDDRAVYTPRTILDIQLNPTDCVTPTERDDTMFM